MVPERFREENNMSVATTWLEKYLAADGRNLKKPDGRPLYAYAMETSEFESLAENWVRKFDRLLALRDLGSEPMVTSRKQLSD